MLVKNWACSGDRCCVSVDISKRWLGLQSILQERAQRCKRSGTVQFRWCGGFYQPKDVPHFHWSKSMCVSMTSAVLCKRPVGRQMVSPGFRDLWLRWSRWSQISLQAVATGQSWLTLWWSHVHTCFTEERYWQTICIFSAVSQEKTSHLWKSSGKHLISLISLNIVDISWYLMNFDDIWSWRWSSMEKRGVPCGKLQIIYKVPVKSRGSSSDTGRRQDLLPELCWVASEPWRNLGELGTAHSFSATRPGYNGINIYQSKGFKSLLDELRPGESTSKNHVGFSHQIPSGNHFQTWTPTIFFELIFLWFPIKNGDCLWFSMLVCQETGHISVRPGADDAQCRWGGQEHRQWHGRSQWLWDSCPHQY